MNLRKAIEIIKEEWYGYDDDTTVEMFKKVIEILEWKSERCNRKHDNNCKLVPLCDSAVSILTQIIYYYDHFPDCCEG